MKKRIFSIVRNQEDTEDALHDYFAPCQCLQENPPQRSASVGEDADEILRVVRKGSDDEQDALRLQIVGLK